MYARGFDLIILIRNEYVTRDGCQRSLERFVASVRKEAAVRTAGKDHRDRFKWMDRGQPDNCRQCGTAEDVSQVNICFSLGLIYFYLLKYIYFFFF